jgi:prevent-host-death family protein
LPRGIRDDYYRVAFGATRLSPQDPSSDSVENPARGAVDYVVTNRPTLGGGRVKFVNSREIRVNPGLVLDAVTHGHEVVITSRGKPVALMMGVNDDLEETVRLVRRARAQGAVSRMRRAPAGRGSHAPDREDIEAEIRAARSARCDGPSDQDSRQT